MKGRVRFVSRADQMKVISWYFSVITMPGYSASGSLSETNTKPSPMYMITVNNNVVVLEVFHRYYINTATNHLINSKFLSCSSYSERAHNGTLTCIISRRNTCYSIILKYEARIVIYSSRNVRRKIIHACARPCGI